MTAYSFDGQHRFRLDGYNKAKPFSGFLPGIAGVDGTPMWVFYVNRGQGIASFGVRDKDCAIMEFLPANKSYQTVPAAGFRTFIKWERGGRKGFLEPFHGRSAHSGKKEHMTVAMGSLELGSENMEAGLKVEVQYYTIPGERFAALARRVTLVNEGDSPVLLEVLDGLPAVLPYGLENSAYKELGHTLKSWMDVYNLDYGIPLYKVRASTADSAEVSQVEGGHFYLSFLSDDEGDVPVRPIVDAELIFGANTSLQEPDGFLARPLKELLDAVPVTANKVPCGFTGLAAALQPGGSVQISTLIGHTSDIGRINAALPRLARKDYMDRKLREAEQLIQELTVPVHSETAMPLLDAYARQCYLDNVLRGGYPLMLGSKDVQHPYHVYSRKHGDLERDYNFFSLQPGLYSQGNGNYRDVNQNRRSDVFFEPELGAFNVRLFMNLIQADGYNPLVVKGSTFRLSDSKDLAALLTHVQEADRDKVEAALGKSFTPGTLMQWLTDEGIVLKEADGLDKHEHDGLAAARTFMELAMSHAVQETDAVFGEGYWVDHWTYNMDHIESYLAVYPDKLEELLFLDKGYVYYDSPAYVLPRTEKYVLSGDKVRQYGAVREDEEKEHFLASRALEGPWVRTEHGKGSIYRTNLYEKLLSLALTKFATMDPYGLGIEMEAGKPGWNDSLNGLPGLFGSGFGETCELLRVVRFLLGVEGQLAEQKGLKLPAEMALLLRRIAMLLKEYAADRQPEREFRYWDAASGAREHYRQSVRLGFSGELAEVGAEELLGQLEAWEGKLEEALKRGLELGGGIYPTYFYYEAEEYKPLLDEQGEMRRNGKGLPLVRITRFRQHVLPPFLEGAARAMKVLPAVREKHSLYDQVRSSGIYDRKLGMYKVNAPLNAESFELGRGRAFTPGWLENESVFLHMEYKYLLELLKSGLYGHFFTDMRHALIPFLKPEVYGRSTLENSSFIASSANPDLSLHGTGFVARLSGSTAEYLQMWQIMMTGHAPFAVEEGVLCLKLSPVLPGWLFDGDNKVAFRFLNACQVTYWNEERRDTYGSRPASAVQYSLTMHNGTVVRVEGSTVREPYASMIRSKQVKAIEVILRSVPEDIVKGGV
jgi:hypothetical protein